MVCYSMEWNSMSAFPCVVRERMPEYGRGRGEEGGSGPVVDVDPFLDADALEELEEEIAVLAAHIHAATHRLLTLIAEFDRRRGWELGGHRSCAYWLSAKTGIDLGAAREKVRAARVLEGLPETSASMARGELSFSKVRALTRVATAENEGELLEYARGCTTAELERMVRGFKLGTRAAEVGFENARFESRTLSVFPDLDGMYVVRGRLPPEMGALLMRAIEAAGDALYRGGDGMGDRVGAGGGDEGKGNGAGSNGGDGQGGTVHGPDSQLASARRRADALGLLAERALGVGFEGGGVGGGGIGGRDAPVSGSRAERYQVVLHVEAETLRADGGGGRSELEDGINVSAETSRRLACDCGLVPITHQPGGGKILSVGRRTRTISPALRRALKSRDRGCRFPGCGVRFTEGHHVVHWADGGETSLSNCLLLCGHHHRLMHEGGWKVDWWGVGNPVFFDPRGGTHFNGRWQLPSLGEDAVEALKEEQLRQGVTPNEYTASSRWKREDDIPRDVYFGALEASGEGAS